MRNSLKLLVLLACCAAFTGCSEEGDTIINNPAPVGDVASTDSSVATNPGTGGTGGTGTGTGGTGGTGTGSGGTGGTGTGTGGTGGTGTGTGGTGGTGTGSGGTGGTGTGTGGTGGTGTGTGNMPPPNGGVVTSGSVKFPQAKITVQPGVLTQLGVTIKDPAGNEIVGRPDAAFARVNNPGEDFTHSDLSFITAQGAKERILDVMVFGDVTSVPGKTWRPMLGARARINTSGVAPATEPLRTTFPAYMSIGERFKGGGVFRGNARVTDTVRQSIKVEQSSSVLGDIFDVNLNMSNASLGIAALNSGVAVLTAQIDSSTIVRHTIRVRIGDPFMTRHSSRNPINISDPFLRASPPEFDPVLGKWKVALLPPPDFFDTVPDGSPLLKSSDPDVVFVRKGQGTGYVYIEMQIRGLQFSTGETGTITTVAGVNFVNPGRSHYYDEAKKGFVLKINFPPTDQPRGMLIERP